MPPVFARSSVAARSRRRLWQRHLTRVYSDLGAFLDSVDIVGIALPPEVQPHFALAAAKAGKAAILEKPLALDPLAAEDIAVAFEQRGLPALILFPYLLIPETLAWLSNVATSGRWIAARIESYSRLFHDQTHPFFNTVAPWRGAAGALWDSGPHFIALLLMTLGEITEVSAVRGQGDLKILSLTHASGAVSSISITFDAPAGVPGEIAFFGAAGKTILPESSDWFAASKVAYVNRHVPCRPL